MIFPEEHELLWLFESEPEILEKDEDIPLYYKLITFHIERNGNKIIDFHVTRMVAARVQKKQRKEFLEVDFQEETTMKTLYLYLKPFVQLSWSMEF